MLEISCWFRWAISLFRIRTRIGSIWSLMARQILMGEGNIAIRIEIIVMSLIDVALGGDGLGKGHICLPVIDCSHAFTTVS
jgi:hypothetical protein